MQLQGRATTVLCLFSPLFGIVFTAQVGLASPLSSLLSSLEDQPAEERLVLLREKFLHRANQNDMEEKRLLFLLGYYHFSLKEYAMSALYFHTLIRKDYPVLADYAHYYLAESLFALDRLEPALVIYQRLVSQFPASRLVRPARFRIATIAQAQKELAQALFLYTAYLQAYPEDERYGEILYRRGIIYQELGKNTEAVREWRRLWIHNPADPFAEQARNAEEQLRKTTPVPPPSPDQLYTRSNILFKAYRFQEALEGYQELLEQMSAPAWRAKLLYQIAWCYYRLWQNEQAIAAFHQFLQEFPDHPQALEAEYTLGKLYLRLEQPKSFLTVSRKLLQDSPRSTYAPRLLYLLGNFYEEHKAYQEALQYFEQLLTRFPQHELVEDTLWHMGWTYYLLTQYPQAIQTWERLARSYPKSKYLLDVIYWQGRAAAKMQQWSQAVNLFRQIRTQYPQTFYAQQIDVYLKEIAAVYPAATPLLKKAGKNPGHGLERRWPDQLVISSPKIQELWTLHLFKEAAVEMALATPPPEDRLLYYFQTAVAFYRGGEEGKAARELRRHFWDALSTEDETLPPIFWYIAYPLRFSTGKEELSFPPNLDPRLVAAVILAESLWNAEARSPAGAIGLMQIMPHTGKRLAQDLGLDFPSEEILSNQRINLSLGVHYLHQLLQQFDYQLIPAIASYNAGEDRVATWWERWQHLESDEFITNIPFFETRRYVQKVLAYYQIYQHIYPKPFPDTMAEQKEVE